MSMEAFPVRLWTDVEEMQERVKIAKRVHDGCTSQTPSVDRIKVPCGFSSSSALVSDHVCFIENDPVPENLEERA
jgi:hypothetical protein